MADFGLARSDGAEELERSAAVRDGGAELAATPLLRSPLTVAGTIMGTPAYMSPEQHRGELADGRSDQFSFCASLYEALYGQLPFAGETLLALSNNVLSGKVRPLPLPTPVPSQVGRAVRRGLATEPGGRFPSMAELLRELAIDPARDPAGAPQARRYFLAFLIVAVLAAAFMLRSAGRHGELTVGRLLLAGGVLFVALLVASVALRNTLLRNSFHRGLVKLLVVLFGQLVAVRSLGLLLAMSVTQVMAIDMVVIGGMAAAISVNYLPLGWPIVPFCAAVAAGLVLFPATVTPIAATSYPVLAILFAVLWNRAAGDRARCDAEDAAKGVASRVHSYISTMRSKDGTRQRESVARGW